MAFPTLAYTLTNSTTADADQVMANFNALLNGISDTTKDVSVAALTTSGAVILGNATGDDITVNGSLASSVPVKTTYSYDLGTATIGLRSVYLGDAGSAARSTRLIGATVASSYTLTTPPTAGTTGQFPVTDGSGTLAFRYPDKTAGVQTGAYAATGDVTLIPCDVSGGAFSVTLPAIASFPYKRYRLQLMGVDASYANALTIARTGADTFTDNATTGGTSSKLHTLGETVEIVNDGTSIWYVQRTIPSKWIAYTPTCGLTGGTNTCSGFWRRVGDSVHCRVDTLLNPVFTGGTATFTIPNSGTWTVDTGKIGGTPSSLTTPTLGIARFHDVGTDVYVGNVFYGSTTTVIAGVELDDSGASSNYIASANAIGTTLPFTWANSDRIFIDFIIPITGLNA